MSENVKGRLGSFVLFGMWALTGWLIGLVLKSSHIGLAVGLFVIATVVGTNALASTCRFLFIGQWGYRIGLLGPFLVFLGGGAFLLNHKVSTTSAVSFLILIIGTVLELAGAIWIYVNVRAIKAHPDRFNVVRPLQPSKEFVGKNEPLEPVWRIKGLIQILLNNSPLGLLLMPFALWPWMNWIMSLTETEVSPLIISFVVTFLIYIPVFLIALTDPRPAYLERGSKKIIEAHRKESMFDSDEIPSQGPDEKQRKEIADIRESAAADFCAALNSRAFDSIDGSSRLRPKALSRLAESLLYLERAQEAHRYAQEAVRIDPRYADGHFWLGISLYELNRKAEALEAFRNALEQEKLEPKRAAAQDWIKELESEISPDTLD